jgi:FG-GAP-like repeat
MTKRRWSARAGALMIAVAVAGCSSRNDPAAVAPVQNDLYLWPANAAWPGRSIPVCWAPAGAPSYLQPTVPGLAISDYPETAVEIRGYLRSSWTQATGLSLPGWAQCPADPSGSVELMPIDRIHDPLGYSYTIGYAPSGTGIELSTSATRVAIHEFGHTLGFTHEEARPEGSECSYVEHAPGGDTLNTPQDDRSIMEYCSNQSWLSYWDEIGAQNAYGRPDYFADVNGDGFDDAIVVNPTGISVRLSNGATLGPATDWVVGAFYGQQGTFFADVDGDLRADAIAVNADGCWVRLSTGSAFASTATSWAKGEFAGSRLTAFADVTGDGLADAIAIREDGIWVMPSNGSSFLGRDQRWASSFFLSDFLGTRATVFADVTGDRRADAVIVTDTQIRVMASTGSAFAPSAVWWPSQSLSSFAGPDALLFTDVTGDGLADVIRVGPHGVGVMASTGSAFSAETPWTSSSYFGERGVAAADVTGDGRADLIAVGETITAIASTGSSFSGAPTTLSSTPFYSTRVTPACVNGVKDGDESDVDCGGACVLCALGRVCARPTDCGNGTCISGVCVVAPSCRDGVKNGRETDVDCGGFCPLCADHKHCSDPTDCQSGACGANGCQPGTCTDGLRDTGETGTDCGGSTSCPRCGLGQPCLSASDCASGFCNRFKLVCQVLPGCANGIRDGSETDVDCGGSDLTCTRCADDHRCSHPTDCASGLCGLHFVNGVFMLACQAATCADGVANGGESDVDCGGATSCGRCAALKACTAGSDCASGTCREGVCIQGSG